MSVALIEILSPSFHLLLGVACKSISNIVPTSSGRTLERQTRISVHCALRHVQYLEMLEIGPSFGLSKGHFFRGNVFLCTCHILRGRFWHSAAPIGTRVRLIFCQVTLKSFGKTVRINLINWKRTCDLPFVEVTTVSPSGEDTAISESTAIRQLTWFTKRAFWKWNSYMKRSYWWLNKTVRAKKKIRFSMKSYKQLKNAKEI